MSPTRRQLLKSVFAAGAVAVLPETTFAAPAPIDPDDVPFLEDGKWVTWRELDKPFYVAADAVETALVVVIGTTKNGESFSIGFDMKDGTVMQVDERRRFVIEGAVPGLAEFPKWMRRQIGHHAFYADEWNPIRRRVAAERAAAQGAN